MFVVCHSFSELIGNSVDQNIDHLSIRNGSIGVESIYLSLIVLDSASLSKFYKLAVVSIRLIVVPVIISKRILSFFPCVEG